MVYKYISALIFSFICLVSFTQIVEQDIDKSAMSKSKEAIDLSIKYKLEYLTRSDFKNFDPIEYASLNYPKDKMNSTDPNVRKTAWTTYTNNHPYKLVLNLDKVDVKSIPKYDRPDLAYIHDYMRHMDPTLGYVPNEKRNQAIEIVHDITPNQNRAISNFEWVERGPNNIGGRTRAIMWDPNDVSIKKVWAGSVGGGLWFNDDVTSASSSWFKVDDFWENIAVTCIAFDPSNTQIFYVGTGEGFYNSDSQRGNGIWKTSDGGITWSRISSTTSSSFYYVNDLAVSNTGVVYAATRNGLFRSDNGGTSWTNPTGTSGNYFDLEITANGTVIAAKGNGTLQRSTTSLGTAFGTAISPGTGGSRVEVAVAPSDANIVYAIAESNTGNIQWFKKSIDEGATWSVTITVPKYLEQNCTVGSQDFTRGQSWYDLILAVSPSDPNIILAGGVDIHRTTNGGTSWTSVSYWTGGCSKPYVHADQHAMAFRPGFNNECLFGTDGGVFYSSNIGNSGVSAPSFNERNTNYNVTQYYAVAIENVASSNIMLAGAQDNGSHRFTSTGINSVTEVTGGDGAFCHIDQDNSNFQITSYVYNSYYRSTNGGASFTSLTSGSGGLFINPTDYDNLGNILYCAENANTLYRISNITGTPSYTSNVSTGTIGTVPTAITTSPYTANRVFVAGSNGNIRRLDNANATPSSIDIDPSNTLPTGYINSIVLGSSDNHIIVTYSNYGGNKVYQTLDGGTTWINKTGNLPDMPINWSLINPSNSLQVVLATEVGVWSTEDISASPVVWESSNTGLANVRCDMLQIRSSDKLIAVATHGRGVFTSDVFADPLADFSSNQKVNYIDNSLTFNDASLKATSWNWDFGVDATPATASGSGPHYVTYSSSGFKTVSLTINGGISTITKTNYIQILPNKSLPYSTDYESNSADFGANTINGTGWLLGNPVGLGSSSGGSNAWATGLVNTNYAINSESYLYSPNFDLSASQSYFLDFNTRILAENQYDGMILEYSLNKGGEWNKLGNAVASTWYNSTSASDNTAFPASSAIFSNNTGTLATSYANRSFDCSFLSGNPNVAFRFVFKTDPGVNARGIGVDNFNINSGVPPISDFSSSSTTICAGSTITYTDLSTNNASSWSWTFPGGTPATSTAQNPTVTYSTPGTYNVTLTASNGAGSGTTMTKVSYITVNSSARAATCNPTSGNTTYGITNVTLNTINNTTPLNDGAIIDYSCTKTTSLTTNTLYNISTTVGTAGPHWLRVYIDYNDDGDFVDAGENIFAPANGTGTLTGSFTTPASVSSYNTLLRMRVITDRSGGGATTPGPCTALSRGQAEDYGVIILPPCTNPTITVSSGTTRCGEGSVTFSATPSAGIINWYDASTNGTLVGTGTTYNPSLSNTTTYYAEAVDGACKSDTRTTVTCTINPNPTITASSGTTRCGTGLVTFSSTPSAGIINWYDAATGGNLVGTGTSYSPSVSNSTTLYAEAVDGACVSIVRSLVSAIVNTIPSITSSAGAVRCFNGTLDLAASASAGDVKWYDAQNAGALLFTGNNYTTPDISYTTSYWAEANDGTCASERTEVIATIEACSKIIDVQCGTTINTTSTRIHANHVTSLTASPTVYHFQISSVNGSTTYTSTNRWFTFADINPAQFTYGTTYNITLRVDRGIGSYGIVGESCQVKSPNTRILSNATMPSVTSLISAATVPTATRYRFRVYDGVSTQIIVSSTNSISFARTNIASLKFNHPYSISVASEVAGVWSGYGPAATITSPKLQLVDAQCGATINANTTQILCNFITGATTYRFRVRDMMMGNPQVIDKTLRYFTLQDITYTNGITYMVDVAVQINGVFTPYSTICTITAPGVAGMMVSDNPNALENPITFEDLVLETYPNPNDGNFTISASHEGTFNIINELGQLIQKVEITKENNYQMKVENLRQGVYFLTGTINNEVITRKVMVQ
jgi:PKD repeat protein